VAWEWTLLRGECTGCGVCADLCTHGALRMPREAAYPEPVPGRCAGCMTCVEECPFDAIDLRERSGEDD